MIAAAFGGSLGVWRRLSRRRGVEPGALEGGEALSVRRGWNNVRPQETGTFFAGLRTVDFRLIKFLGHLSPYANADKTVRREIAYVLKRKKRCLVLSITLKSKLPSRNAPALYGLKCKFCAISLKSSCSKSLFRAFIAFVGLQNKSSHLAIRTEVQVLVD